MSAGDAGARQPGFEESLSLGKGADHASATITDFYGEVFSRFGDSGPDFQTFYALQEFGAGHASLLTWR